jgi:hypothetical protein
MRFLAVAVVLLTSSIAAAQAPGQTLSFDLEQPPEPPPVKVSYRKDIMISDGLSLAAMTLGPALTRDADVASFGLAGYALGAPIVHIAHGRAGAAAASFAMRAGLPIAGGFLGYKLGPVDVVCGSSDVTTGHSHGSCGGGSVMGLLVGMVTGGVAAVYLDARYLATYEKSASPSWSAGVTRTNGGAMVGFGRAF